MAVRGNLRRIIAAGVLAAACVLPAQAQIQLDAAALRKAAQIALSDGDARRAQTYADALLVRDTSDIGALLIRARALRDLGKLAPARDAARTAWRLADTDPKRYATAMVTAQILSSQNKRTRAQLWLRRAVQHAPSKRAEARAKRDFRYVQQQNKWKTHISLTLAPNSNINNGSARDTSELNYLISEMLFGEAVEFELTGAALALSGVEYGFGVQTRYRFHQTDITAHDVKLSLSYRSFALSNSAKSIAPTSSGSDFAFGTVGIGYGYKRINMDRKGEFALDLSAGQSWYGGNRYASFMRGSLAQTWRPDQATTYRLAFDVEHQEGQRTSDVDTFEISASVNKRLASGNSAFFKVGAKTALSDTKDVEYNEFALRGGYALGRPVLGAAVQIGLGASYRDYDVSPHNRDGRKDLKISADVTATFTQIDYFGFNPSVSLSASTTDSNIGLFEANRVGVNIGIRSSF